HVSEGVRRFGSPEMGDRVGSGRFRVRFSGRPVKERAIGADSRPWMGAVLSIDELLAGIEALHASDLHLAAASPPLVRINGVLTPLEDTPVMTPEETQQLLYQILSTEQQKRLEIDRQIDISHSLSGVARFGVNVFFQRNAVGGAFRLIPHKIRSLEELGHPPVLQKL